MNCWINVKWLAVILAVVLNAVWIPMSQVFGAEDHGQRIFQESCSTCHTIGGGRLVGPDLIGVHEKRAQSWLERFVRSSTSMVESGDLESIAVFEKFSRIPMPDAAITDDEIKEVLSYIKRKSAHVAGSNSGAKKDVSEVVEPTVSAANDDVDKGKDLFQGVIRFIHGGAACNACHDVKNDAVIGGGILAAELTSVFSRMGGAGVSSVLGKPPFPVMEIAYQDKPLTKDEISSLVAFLEYADQEHAYQQPRDYGLGLLVSGMVGSVILLGLYSLLWLRRSKGSINQTIFDRQVKSESDR